MNGFFKIDFFELSFLAEACIPPVPIARAMFWEKLINEYYHSLTENEREKLFNWIIKNQGFDKKNEDCRLFYARYNPLNQYKVRYIFEEKAQEIECFHWNDKYHTFKNTYLNPEYITEVVKIKGSDIF